MNPTNKLVFSLNLDRIQVGCDLQSSKRVLQGIAELLTKGLGEEAKQKNIYHHLLEREKLGNTGIGNGVAIPHSRYAATKESVVALMTMETPVDYDSPDGVPVDVVFGLLVPEDAKQEHLNLLAEIARLMSNPRHKAALASSTSSEDAMSLLRTWAKATG